MSSVEISIIGQLLLAVAAGVLLNLTPCVLPAIPVKVRTIIYQSGGAFGQRLTAAMCFLAGSLLFFLCLGIVTALLHWSWGALFQSRIVVSVLVLTLIGFALLTFSDTAMPVPTLAYSIRGTRYAEALLSGAFSALLGASCTGPFLGGVLTFAVAQPPTTIVGVFVAVGFGLAAPYCVVIMRPSLLQHLPKTGIWSKYVRQGLAFVLLGAAVFFAQSLLPEGTHRWLWLSWGVLFLAWALNAIIRERTWPARAVAIVFVAAGLSAWYFVLGAGGLSSRQRIEWHPLSEQAIVRAAASDQPVLIEFTADWCINCKVLEHRVYASGAVSRRMRATNTLALRGDLTRPDAKLQALLQRYGGHGLPFALVIDRRGNVSQRFSGLFTRAALLKAITRDQQQEQS